MSGAAERHSAISVTGFQTAHTLCGEASFRVQTLALLKKDIRAELRTRIALCAVGVFTFSSLLLLALATSSLKQETVLDPRGVMRPAWDGIAKMGMLWVLLCFSAFSGLAHSFVHEETTGTAQTLRLCMQPEAVFAAKLLFNLLLLTVIAFVVTPVYALITDMPIGDPVRFLALMFSGCIGLSASATIVAALTSRARGTGALYGAVGLPMLAVFLILLLNAAHTLYMRDVALAQSVKDTGGLLSFGVMIIALSGLLFHFVWEDL